MKSIAIIFSHAPYGNSMGQDALNMVFSFSLTMSNIGLFFVDDGIFQLLKFQKPNILDIRNYVILFETLPIYYKNTQYFFCKKSARKRGFLNSNDFLLSGKFLKKIELVKKLNNYDSVLSW